MHSEGKIKSINFETNEGRGKYNKKSQQETMSLQKNLQSGLSSYFGKKGLQSWAWRERTVLGRVIEFLKGLVHFNF